MSFEPKTRVGCGYDPFGLVVCIIHVLLRCRRYVDEVCPAPTGPSVLTQWSSGGSSGRRGLLHASVAAKNALALALPCLAWCHKCEGETGSWKEQVRIAAFKLISSARKRVATGSCECQGG